MRTSDDDLLAPLERVRDLYAQLRLPLIAPDAGPASDLARQGREQVEDYLLPRLRSLDAPLLTVVAGSTGSGKSTVVNSVVGRVVSRPGVLRPTTRHPVLVHNPADEAWFASDRVLPRLPRIRAAVGAHLAGAEDVRGLELVADAGVPTGLALLDAPDIDSVSAANRAQAATLMAAADLWLFLTTAARYADAVPWDALRSAVQRDAAVALVLNRVPPDSVAEVTGHLRRLLAAEGLGSAPLFVVVEEQLQAGLLDARHIDPVRRWLADLAADAAARAGIARRTLHGAVGQLAADVGTVAAAADRQVLVAERLRQLAEQPFAAAVARVDEAMADGSLLQGEVLARWQEFVGAGELLRSLETTMGRLRDRMSRAIRGEPVPQQQVAEAIQTGLLRVLLDELATACEAADLAWRDDPAGLALLGPDDLSAGPPGARADAAALVRQWQDAILVMVRTEGAGRRSSARALAYGVNAAALALMIVVFSATGGITGAEVGIAGGAAVLAQKVLEAVFSDDAVRRMSATARELLATQVQAFFAQAAAQFTDRLEAAGVDPAGGAALRTALARIEAVQAAAPSGADLPPAPSPPPAARPDPPQRRPRRRWREWLRGGS